MSKFVFQAPLVVWWTLGPLGDPIFVVQNGVSERVQNAAPNRGGSIQKLGMFTVHVSRYGNVISVAIQNENYPEFVGLHACRTRIHRLETMALGV